ncbi:MAG: FprA family A-type flavoprotein [Clostridiales bacterium]|jgi:flavorubredoxin|nr:FprA family A-type flavoprotein [Clostridiales bacterium]
MEIMPDYKPLTVRDGITWVGALDYDIKVFDIIMRTDYGTTYNAYIVRGAEKIALVEVSKAAFWDEFAARAEEAAGLSKIDYIVLNHTEPDHTGSLAKLLAVNPDATVVGTRAALGFVSAITNAPFNRIVAGEGSSLDLGGVTLRFIPVPFLHWPDTMFTYSPELKALFTCDAFGCHYADAAVFNDVIAGDFYDAYKYYFDNILGPFRPHVRAMLEKISSLDFDIILPGHGPVLRADLGRYIGYYREWAREPVWEKPTVTIPFVSAYGYTRRLAEAISDGLREAGAEVFPFDLVYDDAAECLARINVSDGLIIGTPTLVGDALPPIYKLLADLNPIIHRGKLAAAFGSFGWSGEGVPNVEARFKALKLKIVLPGLKVNFNPDDADIDKAREFGFRFGAEAVRAHEGILLGRNSHRIIV